MTQPLQLAALAGLLAPIACQEPDPAERWQGERITVESREGVELCGGSIEFMDSYIEHVGRFWGTEGTPERLHLELRGSSDGFEGGAASTTSAWAGAEISVLHEIGHLVTNAADGRSAPSLTEGFASALAPRDPAGMWGVGAGEPEGFAFLSGEEFELRHYEGSAQLTRFLIQRYGVETFREAYIAADPQDTSEEIESAYLSTFGDGLYEAFDDFLEEPQCGLRAWECEVSFHPTLQLPLDIVSPSDCAQDPEWAGASGDLNEFWYPHRRFLLQLTEDTEVVVVAENARVARSSCEATCPSPLDWPPGFSNMAEPAPSGETPVRLLEAGTHTVHVLPVDPSRSFSVRIEPAG